MEEQPKISEKEQRIRNIAMLYYSRQDVRKYLLEFSKNRECVPRYFEGFGTRPDTFQYDSDILELAKRGATSFHCSEELWQDPLLLSTSMKESEIKQNRIGWDLLIDVDSKYFDYSKAYAEVLIEVLKAHGVKHIGVKFSGSKGLHVIIPNKAFPQELSGKKTCEMFPEWPRLICKYLSSKVAEKLKNKILDLGISNETQDKQLEYYCLKCNETAEKKLQVSVKCPKCKTKMQFSSDAFHSKRVIRCSICSFELTSIIKKAFESEIPENGSDKQEFFICSKCQKDSIKNRDNFKQRIASKHIDADLVLVSPRHLFRMPYSLHEKTALASVVINSDKIHEFNMQDANPLRVQVRDFIPDSEEGEALHLLREALDFKPREEQNQSSVSTTNLGEKKFADIIIQNLTPDLYPPSIKKILEGAMDDGKKRALFILLSFFFSLKLSQEQISSIIAEWNAKNKEPLRDGYIKAQLSWYSKNKGKLPPNFDKSYYRDIGIIPTPDEIRTKNPVSYVIKKYLSGRGYKK